MKDHYAEQAKHIRGVADMLHERTELFLRDCWEAQGVIDAPVVEDLRRVAAQRLEASVPVVFAQLRRCMRAYEESLK